MDGMGGITNDKSVITIASIVFALIFIIIIAYFIYRYRKKLRAWLKSRKAKLRLLEPVIAESLLSAIAADREVSTGDPRVQILFPQIEKPLPPVWGIGEPLAINSRVNADDIPGDNISAPQLKAAEKTLDITVSNLTPVSIEHTFGDKGKVDVSITFGSETADKISASRGIKIVDYREENVALFNGLVDLLAAKGVAVNRTMTAREIEGKLQDKYPSLVQSDLADIVRGFEFANYSLRPVARRVYVEMYLAIEKIREKLNAA